jgi:thymidylate synthase
VRLAPHGDLFAFQPADVKLEGYRAHPPIKAPIAV